MQRYEIILNHELRIFKKNNNQLTINKLQLEKIVPGREATFIC